MSGKNDGKKLSGEIIKNARLTFQGNRHTVKVGETTYKGTRKLSSTEKPKSITITDTEGPFKDRMVLGIYELDGDEFRICYALPGKERPKDVSAKEGTGYHCHVWKRSRK